MILERYAEVDSIFFFYFLFYFISFAKKKQTNRKNVDRDTATAVANYSGNLSYNVDQELNQTVWIRE